jgi:TetR/AcrR family transcriptional repressor of mexCD-oprJ operon
MKHVLLSAVSSCGSLPDQLLRATASALVDKPFASLQELAKSTGVSEAILCGFCSDRDNLIALLYSGSLEQLDETIAEAHLETGSIGESLKSLTEGLLRNKEFLIFLTHRFELDEEVLRTQKVSWQEFQTKIDRFFLRGKFEGSLRNDVSAAAMSEVFIGMLLALINSARVGRIAESEILCSMETMFLKGVNSSCKT